MIDWLLSNQPHIIRWSRWIILCCAAALLGISRLPHNAFDRIVAIMGLIVVATIFVIWLGVALTTIFKPRLFGELRRRRAEATNSRQR